MSEKFQKLYDAFNSQDMETLGAAMDANIEWFPAEGSKYRDNAPYVGFQNIVANLYSRLPGDWDNFKVTPNEFFESGTTMIVRGRLTGTAKATGKSLDSPFVHFFTTNGDKITRFEEMLNTQHQHELLNG